MAFCTKCGHKNGDEGRFCEECGTPLKAATSAPPTVSIQAQDPSPVAPRLPAKKIALFAGVGALVVAIAAGVTVFAFRAESPSNTLFASLIEKSLQDNPAAYKSHYCLRNFAYDKDPVFVGAMDSGTQRWMAVLTKAGLYAEPEVIVENGGFFSTEQLKYQKTEAGKKATDGRSLCYADGVTVKTVDSFTQAAKAGDLQVSKATVTLELKNPMPWVSQVETKQAGIDVQTEFQDSKLFLLKERKWILATEADIRAAQSGGLSQEQSQSASTSGGQGFFSSLLKLFGGHGNPLIGHWKSTVMGIDVAVFEFDADSMGSNEGRVKVRYEVTDKDVTVYPQDAGIGLVFKVIDANTMSVNMGMAEFQIKRTN